MTDSETTQIIEKAIAGDQDALLKLLLDMKAELNRFVAAKLAGSPTMQSQRDDILQETYIRACREIKNLRVHHSKGLMAWLKVIALNQIRDVSRRKSTAKRGGDRAHVELDREGYSNRAWGLVMEVSDTGMGTPSAFMARHEAIDAIRIALSQLPEHQRQAMQLHYFHGYTLDETAAKMERTSDSVRGLIQRGKQSLRDAMVTSSLWLSRKG